jgi:hypothetical protein
VPALVRGDRSGNRSPRNAGAGNVKGEGDGTGAGSPKTPGRFPSQKSQSPLWGGLGSGDFDREAERYKAVIEMLEGSSGSPRLGGGGSGGGGREAGSRGARDGESSSMRRRREMATDPALVLETRSVRISRRTDAQSILARLNDGNDDLKFNFADAGGQVGGDGGGGSGGGDGGDGAAWLHVTVEAPRVLIAAARRDALVRWVRDAWTAALKPAVPEHSLSELRRMASSSSSSFRSSPSSRASSAAAAAPSGVAGAAAVTDALVPKQQSRARGGGSGGKAASNKHRRSSSAHGVAVFDEDFSVIVPDFDVNSPRGAGGGGSGADDAADDAAVAVSASFSTTAGTVDAPRQRALSPTQSQDLLSLLMRGDATSSSGGGGGGGEGGRVGDDRAASESAGSGDDDAMMPSSSATQQQRRRHRRTVSEMPAASSSGAAFAADFNDPTSVSVSVARRLPTLVDAGDDAEEEDPSARSGALQVESS